MDLPPQKRRKLGSLIEPNFEVPSAKSLPGGALICPECKGLLICPNKITDLALEAEVLKESYASYARNITVKVRVIEKTKVREGRTNDINWNLFDMHVVNIAGEELEVYVIVFGNAQKIHDLIQVGKAYFFARVSIIRNEPHYSRLPDAPFALRFEHNSVVIPAYEELPSLRELAMRAAGKLVSRIPNKETMLPYMEKIPGDLLEQMLTNRYLSFEAINAVYATQEYHSLIPSLTHSCYIMTRESCLIHAYEKHKNSGLDLYQDLHCVYDDISPFNFTTKDAQENAIPKLLVTAKSFSTDFPIVKTLSEFKRQFNLFTRNILADLNWNNLFCAGGSVLAAITPFEGQVDDETLQNYYYSKNSLFYNSDIDIFLYGLNTDEEYNNKLEEIIATITRNITRLRQTHGSHASESHGSTSESQGCASLESQGIFLARTPNTVSIISAYPMRIIQLVIMPSPSPAYTLAVFDVDCACVGFDGQNVWVSQRGIRAITKRYNLIEPRRHHNSYSYRHYKYAKRGYCAAIPHNMLTAEQIRNEADIAYAYRGVVGQLAYLDDKLTQKNYDESELDGYDVAAYSASIPWGPEIDSTKAYAKIKTNENVAVGYKLADLKNPYEGTNYSPWIHPMRVEKDTFESGTCSNWFANDDSSIYYTNITGPLLPLLPPH